MMSPDGIAPYEAALERIDGQVRRALDVGTGTGVGARAIAKHFPNAEIVGVDVAPAMLEEARRLASGIEFVEGDAANLPFGEDEFDLITHANMIPFLDETARVLRPGGWTIYAYSSGDQTPIYVAPERLRRELARRGFTDFAEIAAGRGIAVLARRAEPG
jgi:ubiquinone/menaquinone biosynthesis C-methylase UbiE